jgi:bifunctional enzyme Fae/Hps
MANKLNPKKRYLQIALNDTLENAREVIFSLPKNERIILEAGTPFIKRYGEYGIQQIKKWYEQHLSGQDPTFSYSELQKNTPEIFHFIFGNLFNTQIQDKTVESKILPYIVADLKTMDRGESEVEIAFRGGASAVIALGSAPTETLNSFIQKCDEYGMDSMIDMMNVEFPLTVLQNLKKIPSVVILHRGVDEEKFNREKQIPLHEIRRIKGRYNIMISIAGGDTIREIQRSIFNDADIVVIWKSVFQKTEETSTLVESFLKEIR